MNEALRCQLTGLAAGLPANDLARAELLGAIEILMEVVERRLGDTETPAAPDVVVDQVSWAIHAWSCPLCLENGLDATAVSGQDHVSESDRTFAGFLIGALGLRPDAGR